MMVQSTRGAYRTDPVRAVLQGMAPDGGLFVDPELGKRAFDWEACLGLSPLPLMERLLNELLPGFPEMGALVKQAYEGRFSCPELTPLVPVGDDYVLELFHGPTSAFKDVALCMLPRLISAARRLSGEKGDTLILTATSGDTGKAALEGFRDVPGTRILVFYPHGGVSAIQRSQMVTQAGENVGVCGVRGNFDDCQRQVKRAFSALRTEDPALSLSSANSINIGRLAPQTSYYFLAYASLLGQGRIRPGECVDFVVPTGNFGDILAGYMAKRLGLPVGKLVCASNANRVLDDFLRSGVYDRRRGFARTSSPSMDILISSNLERLLYYASGDPELVADCMARLERDGAYAVPDPVMARIREDFGSQSCGESECAGTISRVWREQNYLCDPHTAVAFRAGEKERAGEGRKAPMVILSTASPYKFPGAVLAALTGKRSGDDFSDMDALEALSGVPAPENLTALRGLPERHRDLVEIDGILPYIRRKTGGD